jgi:hypothetical protein
MAANAAASSPRSTSTNAWRAERRELLVVHREHVLGAPSIEGAISTQLDP